MGFPTWTLIGMGITFVIALIMIILAYIALSPGTAAKLGLGGARLHLRVKAFTGYGLAMMLLSLGFFLAGVPLDPALTQTAVETATPVSSIPNEFEITVVATNVFSPTLTPDLGATAVLTPVPTDLTPSSGAFGGPPLADETEEVEAALAETATVPPSVTASLAETSTPLPFTPTSTAPPTPTATATPTITPTPIDGETAVLDLGGSVIWLHRSPGGQQLVVLADEEVVILRDGYANRAGIFWREVSTGDGTIGWVEEEFLLFEE